MEGLTFPVGKLCRIRKVLGGELYFVSIEKTEAGPIEVVAEIESDTLTPEEKTAATLRMTAQEDLFVSMLEDEMIGNIELEGILSHFVKSLQLNRETNILSAVKIDVAAEREKILQAKAQAEIITQEKEKQDEAIRAQKARKRAERAQAKLENVRLAKQHLLERVAYARKIMAIEVKRLGELKKARKEREIKIEQNAEPATPTLVLPEGKLLRVRRVINSEMASLEIEKRKQENGSAWQVVFTTTGLDTGVEHSLTTTEIELTALLQEQDYGKETSDLLRIFSKMIAFEQQGSDPGLRLHQVDEAAEKERIRQWRDQALRVSGATTSVTSGGRSSSEGPAAAAAAAAVPAVPEKKTSSIVQKKDTNHMLATIDNIASGGDVNQTSQLFEKNKQIGDAMYLVSFRLSGHKLFVTGTQTTGKHIKLEYSCSLEHALMLLPSEQQLWDNETELFTSLFPCVQLGKGRSLTLRRRTRKNQRLRETEELVAMQQNSIEKDERQRLEDERNQTNQALRNRAIYKRRHGSSSSDLERKIEEHYLNSTMGGEGNEKGSKRKQQRKRTNRKDIRLESLPLMDGEDSEEIKDRMRSLEQAHQFVVPFSQENTDEVRTEKRQGMSSSSSSAGLRNQFPGSGFGKYKSSAMTQETILEQSSILSVQGNVAARARLRNRLARNGFCGEAMRGPDIDPLFPLEATSKGQLFLKKGLRHAFGSTAQTVTTVMEAPNYEKLRSKKSIIQDVESKMIMAGGGLLFEVAAQQNSWGSPNKKGPGYRATACKFNRINQKEGKRLEVLRKSQIKHHMVTLKNR